MKLAILGSIIGLAGVGLIMSDYKIIGILIFIIGGSIGLKGRNRIDKDKF